MEDFGNPMTTTNYVMCIYDETANVPSLVLQAEAVAGGNWTRLPGSGFRYRSRARSSDTGSLSILRLRAGSAGRARITAISRGDRLNLARMPSGAFCAFSRDPMGRCMLAGDTRVTVQLQQVPATLDGCWEAVYESPPIRSGIDRFFDIFDGRLR
jgi:hypothetical protein